MAEGIELNCKACGEPGVKVVETTENYSAPFGNSVGYQQRHTECDICGVEMDVSDPDAFSNAIREAELSSVEEILDFFKERGIPQGRIERSLELPNRQISNWKSKEAWSKSGLALLRILRAYPWIIEVADRHFKMEVVREKLMEAAHLEYVSQSEEQDFSNTGVAMSGARLAWSPALSLRGESDQPGFGKMMAATALAATALVSAMGYTKEVDVLAVHPRSQFILGGAELSA